MPQFTRPCITRRQALATLAATAAVPVTTAALAAPFLRTAPKSGLEPVVLGEGDWRFECVHDWARVPSHIALGNTHGVCQDAAGNVYIKHTVHASSSSPDAIAVFDADGAFVRSWGAQYRGGAHGLHYSREPGGEFLYLCDQARGVVDKTTLTGEVVWSLTCPMQSGLYEAPGEYHPTNVAVVPHGLPSPWDARAGHVYIADGYGKSWIHHYDAAGAYLRSWGGPGKERGQVACPHGLIVDARTPARPRLVIADRSNNRLQSFTLDVVPIGIAKGDVRMPCHFDIRGSAMVVPDLLARVTLLGPDDKPLVHLGDGTDYALRDKPREKFIAGKFIAPHGACFDRDGNVLVVEWVEVGRVTKLRRV
jgi:hypothetical protein